MMSNSLQKRLHMLIRQTLDSYRGAWLLWCDPYGEWRALLTQIATDQCLGVFPLVVVNESGNQPYAPGALWANTQSAYRHHLPHSCLAG
ncbi:MAG: hypothetical protein ACPGWR_16485 [Ardenticatenaceae bacterium]